MVLERGLRNLFPNLSLLDAGFWSGILLPGTLSAGSLSRLNNL